MRLSTFVGSILLLATGCGEFSESDQLDEELSAVESSLVIGPIIIPSSRCSARGPTASRSHIALRRKYEFIWQGFDHEWDNHVHRMGDFMSRTWTDSVSRSGSVVTMNGTATMDFTVGATADTGTKKLNHRGWGHPKIGVTRGSEVFELSDVHSSRWDRRTEEASDSRVIEIPLRNDVMNEGCFDNYTAVLRGFKIDFHNPSPGSTCHPDAIYPMDLSIDIDNCEVDAAEEFLRCDVSVDIFRERGVDTAACSPPSMDYTVTVFWTAIGGHDEHFRATDIEAEVISNQSLTSSSIVKTTRTVSQPTGYDDSATAITGFDYHIHDTGPGIRNGRMLKRYAMKLLDGEAAAGNSSKTIHWTVGLDKGINFAGTWDAGLRTRQLQINEPVRSAPLTQSVVGGSVITTQTKAATLCAGSGCSTTAGMTTVID